LARRCSRSCAAISTWLGRFLRLRFPFTPPNASQSRCDFGDPTANMTKSTEIFGLRAIGHHHVNARCHEFSGESGKRPTSPPTPNVRQISVWCDRPLMEWFGCAPAQPTTNAGRGHRRQNARHVTETRRASRKADYSLPTRRVDNSGAVRTSHLGPDSELCKAAVLVRFLSSS